MPSLLHVLHVDRYAQKAKINNNEKNNDDDIESLFANTAKSGMSWGAIAVYTCPDSCIYSMEEFVCVQISLDGDIGKGFRQINVKEDNDNDNTDE